MCRVVTCRKCNKPTWAGCGAHVEQVLAHVPQAQRCAGHEAEASSGLAGSIRRLFGRK